MCTYLLIKYKLQLSNTYLFSFSVHSIFLSKIPLSLSFLSGIVTKASMTCLGSSEMKAVLPVEVACEQAGYRRGT